MKALKFFRLELPVKFEGRDVLFKAVGAEDMAALDDNLCIFSGYLKADLATVILKGFHLKII